MNDDGFTAIDNRIYHTQEFLSPAAFGMLIRIHRMTSGYGDDYKALSNVMLQKMCNMSKNTVTNVVKELVGFGFIFVKRRSRSTTVYAMNYAKIFQFVESKKADEPICFPKFDLANDSQNLIQCFPEIDQVQSQILGTIKENTKEKYINKTKEKNKKENSKPEPKKYKPEKPDQVSDQIWSDLLSHRKAKKTSNTQTAWTMIFNQLAKAQNATGHTLDQIITEWLSRDWKGFKSDWYINARSQNQNQNTGFNNAHSQPVNQTNAQPNPFSQPAKQSNAERYAADIARQLAEYEASKSGSNVY